MQQHHITFQRIPTLIALDFLLCVALLPITAYVYHLHRGIRWAFLTPWDIVYTPELGYHRYESAELYTFDRWHCGLAPMVIRSKYLSQVTIQQQCYEGRTARIMVLPLLIVAALLGSLHFALWRKQNIAARRVIERKSNEVDSVLVKDISRSEKHFEAHEDVRVEAPSPIGEVPDKEYRPAWLPELPSGGRPVELPSPVYYFQRPEKHNGAH